MTTRPWIGVAVAVLVVSGCGSSSPEDEPTARPEPYPWSPMVAAVDSAVPRLEGRHLVSARVYVVRAVPQPAMDVRTDPDAVLAAFEELAWDPKRSGHLATMRAWVEVGDDAALQFAGCFSGWSGSLKVGVDPRPGRSRLRFESQCVRGRSWEYEVEVEAGADLTLDLVPGRVAVVTVPASRPRDLFFLVFVAVQ